MSYGKIIAPTESRRVTVQSFIERVLGPSPHQGLRRVQLLIAPGNPVAFSIDHPTPGAAGPGRTFMLPPAPAGQALVFMLLHDQQLYGCTGEGVGLATFGIIVEYME